ncbi:hypothetical protein B0E33_20520 [Roseibium algicola]|uniref:Uncharacterized protein n=1 Tax=Roseibium algicola TaxID=2857014 RepID=A0ABN4WVE8_9HYPH|nr:hypothetical protein B0E33_20520 [Roseibium aggregatum]
MLLHADAYRTVFKTGWWAWFLNKVDTRRIWQVVVASDKSSVIFIADAAFEQCKFLLGIRISRIRSTILAPPKDGYISPDGNK